MQKQDIRKQLQNQENSSIRTLEKDMSKISMMAIDTFVAS